MVHAVADQPECWPALPINSWNDIYTTLHMWTQIVAKVRLRLTPVVNHWWNIPLYVTARGLTTSRIPCGKRAFELTFDFIRHQLVLETSDGLLNALPLEPRSVAELYKELMELLRSCFDLEKLKSKSGECRSKFPIRFLLMKPPMVRWLLPSCDDSSGTFVEDKSYPHKPGPRQPHERMTHAKGTC